MADLVTHVSVVMLPAVLLPRWRTAALVACGAVLPDLASRVPGEVLNQLRLFGAPIPDWWLMPWGMLHLPSALVLLVTLIALGFREEHRVRAWLALMGGVATHLLLDVLQHHHGVGYMLLFPISLQRVEVGLFGSEATVALAPWLGGGTLLVWGLRWARGRKTGEAPAAGEGD